MNESRFIFGQEFNKKYIDIKVKGSEVIFDDHPQAEIYSIKKSFYQLPRNIQRTTIQINPEEEGKIKIFIKKQVMK